MRRSLPSFGPRVIGLFLLTTTAACDRMDLAVSVNGPAPLSANVTLGGSFGVEPSMVRPEVLPGSCGVHSPFGLRLGVTIRGGEDVILRGVRFEFAGRDGARALPEVTPIPSLTSPVPASALPSSSPVTPPGVAQLPASSPIPIPGAPAVTGVLVPAGTHRRFDYFLRFTCIVLTPGEIVVFIDATDRGGRPQAFELRASVGA